MRSFLYDVILFRNEGKGCGGESKVSKEFENLISGYEQTSTNKLTKEYEFLQGGGDEKRYKIKIMLLN